MSTLEIIAGALVAAGKGILAADESTTTIGKRFKNIDIPSTEETRRAYREMLFSAPKLEESLSGVILFDETIRQKDSKGTPFPELLARRGIIPGIKVDKSAKPLAFSPGEKITEGLDGLRERLTEYRGLGAKFTKWRAVIAIGERIPTSLCLRANTHALARYAALSQEAGLVPIVEPEVLMDGNHTIDQCECVTELALKTVFEELFRHRITFEEMLLKPNMILAGKECPQQPTVEEVARKTLLCLRRTVPDAVPGVVFLSGGQSKIQATQHLNAMNLMGKAPWTLTFSFGRALQEPALKLWKGSAQNLGIAQQALLHRARCNSLACSGLYLEEMEKEFEPAPAS